jgi:hypothetical protein
VVSTVPIEIRDGPSIEIEDLRGVVEGVNEQLRAIHANPAAAMSIFELLDFRMMSGLVGEALVTAIARQGLRV